LALLSGVSFSEAGFVSKIEKTSTFSIPFSKKHQKTTRLGNFFAQISKNHTSIIYGKNWKITTPISKKTELSKSPTLSNLFQLPRATPFDKSRPHLISPNARLAPFFL
jgi:hypothetical protein